MTAETGRSVVVAMLLNRAIVNVYIDYIALRWVVPNACIAPKCWRRPIDAILTVSVGWSDLIT